MTALSEIQARGLIERCSRYLEPAPAGLHYYDQSIASAEEDTPGISALVRLVALRSLDAQDVLFIRSAVQALACTGHAEDISSLESLAIKSESNLSSELSAAIAHIKHRSKSIEELLAEVSDKSSFIAFAEARAKERGSASSIEAQDPLRYSVDGALGWKNADISSFIYAGLRAFECLPDSGQPTWAAVAEFLYDGKMVE